MNIPRFWAKAEDQGSASSGKLSLRCWGWSVAGLDEARSRANEALQRLMTRIRQGLPFPERYTYGDRALREEIIREISGAGNEPAGIITRNSYGSLVLNTATVMFIDVDASNASAGKASTGWFKRKAEPQDAALDALRNRLNTLPGSYRIYKTAAGFRVLATDRCYDPASVEAEQLMRSLQADPNFIQLCRAQKSFRARLTPKPWRCGCRVPPSSFPRETSAELNAFETWLTTYESAARQYAVCTRLEDLGSGSVHEDVSRIATWHDEYTKPSSGLPLA